MATIPPVVERSINLFLADVRLQRRLVTVYLYGSQIKGTATHWSDIDLAIVSPDFTADLFQERLALMRFAVKIDDRIEPRLFRPGDFTINDPLVSEIQRTGVRLV